MQMASELANGDTLELGFNGGQLYISLIGDELSIAIRGNKALEPDDVQIEVDASSGVIRSITSPDEKIDIKSLVVPWEESLKRNGCE
jgi:hypothetical protein